MDMKTELEKLRFFIVTYDDGEDNMIEGVMTKDAFFI